MSAKEPVPGEGRSLPLFAPGIVEIAEGGEPRLVGARCPACGGFFFPHPARCRRCLGAVEGCPVGSRGTLYSYTIIRTRAPLGLPEPYGIGYVDLAESGLRVFGLLDPTALDGLRIGGPVRLAVGPLGRNSAAEPCLRPYFTPERPDGGAMPDPSLKKGAA